MVETAQLSISKGGEPVGDILIFGTLHHNYMPDVQLMKRRIIKENKTCVKSGIDFLVGIENSAEELKDNEYVFEKRPGRLREMKNDGSQAWVLCKDRRIACAGIDTNCIESMKLCALPEEDYRKHYFYRMFLMNQNLSEGEAREFDFHDGVKLLKNNIIQVLPVFEYPEKYAQLGRFKLIEELKKDKGAFNALEVRAYEYAAEISATADHYKEKFQWFEQSSSPKRNEKIAENGVDVFEGLTGKRFLFIVVQAAHMPIKDIMKGLLIEKGYEVEES